MVAVVQNDSTNLLFYYQSELLWGCLVVEFLEWDCPMWWRIGAVCWCGFFSSHKSLFGHQNGILRILLFQKSCYLLAFDLFFLKFDDDTLLLWNGFHEKFPISHYPLNSSTKWTLRLVDLEYGKICRCDSKLIMCLITLENPEDLTIVGWVLLTVDIWWVKNCCFVLSQAFIYLF